RRLAGINAGRIAVGLFSCSIADSVRDCRMESSRADKLYIPIILGTARQGRQSEHVANFLLSEMKKRPEIETELIDVRQLKMRLDDAGETMKDASFAGKMTRADGLAIVAPE